MRKHLVNLALKLVGCPYIWGGANPWTGFDCSGFVVWVYQVFGLLPSGDWTAQGLAGWFLHRNEKANQNPKAGDVVFYGPDPDHLTHVMLALGGGLVVGASGGGHETTTTEEARRRGAQVKVKPIGYRNDLQFALSPGFPGE
jgi:cell wall-associated NlpC family hydrolase